MKDFHQLLTRLQRRSLQVFKKGKGMHNGRRKSNNYGSSLEFSDYKLYSPGDDIRQIDWNVYGRTYKPYIKRFMDEKEISVGVYLDATSSMMEIPEKWELAKLLAASFSFLTLNHEDRLFFSVIPTTSASFQRKGSSHSKRTFYEIFQLKNKHKAPFFFKNMLAIPFNKQQLNILISDGLEEIDTMSDLMRRMNGKFSQTWFVHILAEEEINPPYEGDLQLVDSENESIVDVSMSPVIKKLYKKRIKDHNEQILTLCTKHSVHYLPVTTGQDIQTILLQELTAKGYIK